MKITDILDKNCIRIPLKSTEKVQAITELVDLLDQGGRLADRDAVLKAVLDREKARSTGIGLGLAVPHGKSHGCRSLTMAIGKPAKPLEFDAVDARPCDLIVLLISPADETGPHIQALANVSRLWQHEGFRVAEVAAKSADELYAAIENHQA
jgi:mannitol/fructose-specific phosphotransferase system IIA component (Ntr-type)